MTYTDPAELEDRVVTAGVYVHSNALGGLMPFMVEPTNTGDRLGIVRISGHREPGESSWECARRETLEEAGLEVEYMRPPATYRALADDVESELLPVRWPASDCDTVNRQPLLISDHDRDARGPVSALYLTRSNDLPMPAAECQGILLLDCRAVMYLTSATAPTLGKYVERGGRVLLAQPLPLDMPLEPFAQLRWLARMLRWHPELLPL